MSRTCTSKGYPKGPGKRQFEKVFDSGIVVGSALFRVLASSGSGKCGIAVSKKAGSHPARNRLKRRVREILRQAKPNLNSNTDLVVVVKAAAARAPFSDLRNDLEPSLERAAGRWAEESGSF